MKIYELIDGYADMTAEEKLKALEEMDSDSESKKWKDQYNKTAHDLAEAKKKNKTLQEQLDASMDEESRKNAEREREIEEILAERDQLKKDKEIAKITATYLGMGYPQELAESTAQALYDNDFDTVTGNAASFKESFEKSLRAEIIKGNPKPDSKGASSKGETVTKESIMKIKDTAERQKAISEHTELFEGED